MIRLVAIIPVAAFVSGLLMLELTGIPQQLVCGVFGMLCGLSMVALYQFASFVEKL